MTRMSGAAALAAAILAMMSGCAREPGDQGRPEVTVVSFWTTEVERDRMDLQRALADEFHQTRPGIEIRVIPVREQDLDKKLMAASAAQALPDVVRVGLEHVKGYAQAGILSPSAATDVIRTLGEDSFFAGPLKLVTNARGGYDAVPIDGWAQGIWYRRDWFEQESLDPPATWEAILEAAQKFHDPDAGQYGIVVGTASHETYTQQTFEHIALSNGARLFSADGRLVHPNDRLRETLVFYKRLARCGPPGSNSVSEARQFYLTGAAAMIFYSPYIVDDIAGMVEDQIPVEGLAEKTGFIGVVAGLHGDKASYGQVVSLGIVEGDHSDESQKWVKFLLNEGYLRWCFMTPGGKTPVRKDVLAQWREHQVFASYQEGFAERLARGMEGIQRWGYFPERVLPVVTDIYGKHVVAQALGAFLTGKADADATLQRIADEVSRLEAVRR